MMLKIMFSDGIVNEFAITRLFTIKVSSEEQHLYFETTSDTYGKGRSIPLSDIRAWEANAIICGGSQGLKI